MLVYEPIRKGKTKQSHYVLVGAQVARVNSHPGDGQHLRDLCYSDVAELEARRETIGSSTNKNETITELHALCCDVHLQNKLSIPYPS